MLPQALGLPAAVVLILGGAVTCFAGYRLFRFVLGIYGFILGAMLASSLVGVTNTTGMIITAIVGGVIGAGLLVFAYYAGLALVGGGLGALIVHLAWTQASTGDPPLLLVGLAAVAGAVAALMLQRYMIIAGTAFGGAWTMIIGAINVLASRRIIQGGSPTEVWILYPTSIGDYRWAPVAWMILGALGTAVQLGTGKKR
jgi:uncharacterized protein DUF4203